MVFRRTLVEPRRGEPTCSSVEQPSKSTNHRYYGTNLLLCSTAWGVTFLLRQESDQSPPKKATWGRRSDCAVVTLLHFGTTPDSPNSPSPKTPSAQGISSTNQIKNLGSHLPLTREAFGEADSSINIYLPIVPTATPCVPLQRGKSLIDGAEVTDRETST